MESTGLLLLETVEFSWYTILNIHYDSVEIMKESMGMKRRFFALFGSKSHRHELWAKKYVGSSRDFMGFFIATLFFLGLAA